MRRNIYEPKFVLGVNSLTCSDHRDHHLLTRQPYGTTHAPEGKFGLNTCRRGEVMKMPLVLQRVVRSIGPALRPTPPVWHHVHAPSFQLPPSLIVIFSNMLFLPSTPTPATGRKSIGFTVRNTR